MKRQVRKQHLIVFSYQKQMLKGLSTLYAESEVWDMVSSKFCTYVSITILFCIKDMIIVGRIVLGYVYCILKANSYRKSWLIRNSIIRNFAIFRILV